MKTAKEGLAFPERFLVKPSFERKKNRGFLGVNFFLLARLVECSDSSEVGF